MFSSMSSEMLPQSFLRLKTYKLLCLEHLDAAGE